MVSFQTDAPEKLLKSVCSCETQLMPTPTNVGNWIGIRMFKWKKWTQFERIHSEKTAEKENNPHYDEGERKRLKMAINWNVDTFSTKRFLKRFSSDPTLHSCQLQIQCDTLICYINDINRIIWSLNDLGLHNFFWEKEL